LPSNPSVTIMFGGQAVLYYQTLDVDGNDADLFDKEASRGNAGLQIRSKADLGNDFQAGLTANIIGTLGLEGNVVSGVMQQAADINGDLGGYWIPEAYVAKTIGNTTVKLGRQYLNTPLAFSEGWNVFKNSFEAALVVNKDLPDTTVILGMVNKANGNGVGAEMSTFASINPDGLNDDGAVYVLGIINNSIENLNVALWGYNLTSAAKAFWGDVAYKADLGDYTFNLGLQAANLDPDASGLDDTTMWGVKVGTNIQGWGLSVAYDDVDDGALSVQNVGTGVKTKLFVQQILNQGSIALDAETLQLKAVTPKFYGVKLIAQYAMTDDTSAAENDLDELDLILKTKVLDTNLLVAYVNRDYDKTNDSDLVRVVARYSF